MSIKVETMQIIKSDRKGRPLNFKVVYKGSLYNMPPKAALVWAQACKAVDVAPDEAYKIGEVVNGCEGLLTAFGL